MNAMYDRKMRFGIVGLGAIGSEVLKLMTSRGHNLSFAIDSDRNKAGRYLDEIIPGSPRTLVRSTPDETCLKDTDVAIICTSSRLRDIHSIVKFFASGGIDVVSTCEEMAFPWFSEPDLADEIMKSAILGNSTVVGAGVNPGFVMDLVPSVIMLASKNPESIHVTRSVDISKRRYQLRSKLGIGMARDTVERGYKEGKFGHVGLAESLHLIAYSMSKKVEGFSSGYSLILGSEEHVTGVRQFAEGIAEGCKIRLDLEMSLTSADYDLIEVEGEPRLKVRFEGGVFGDTATVAIVANISKRVIYARPGLLTILDIPIAPQSNAFRSSDT
jgi:hypothetical protein